MKRVILQKGRERSVERRHPWIFSGAIPDPVETEPQGELVEVRSSKDVLLGWGWYSPTSQIRVRLLAFAGEPEPTAEVIRARILRAVAARGELSVIASKQGAVRLINAENDWLPGVVVDFYAGYAILQLTSAFGAAKRELIAETLMKAGARGVSERSDLAVRAKEGLPVGEFEHLLGEEPPETIAIDEHGLKLLVDVRKGHKTGYYLDQRAARLKVGECAKGEVLNCFSYTGGFGLSAAKRGSPTKVLQVDVSKEALARAKENAALNGFKEELFEYVEADVFRFLRTCRDQGRSFDTIILDPPKFAETKSQVMKAARGYKDINLLAMKLLKPGGILATFSCSSAMTSELFDQVVAEAAVDAKRSFRIVARTLQDQDHPVALGFPEGQYLKGLILTC